MCPQPSYLYLISKQYRPDHYTNIRANGMHVRRSRFFSSDPCVSAKSRCRLASRARHTGGAITRTAHLRVEDTELVRSRANTTQIHYACREREACKVAPPQRWAGIRRCGHAGQARSHIHASHARSRMRNEACTSSASSEREDVVVEERQVEVGLHLVLAGQNLALGT